MWWSVVDCGQCSLLYCLLFGLLYDSRYVSKQCGCAPARNGTHACWRMLPCVGHNRTSRAVCLQDCNFLIMLNNTSCCCSSSFLLHILLLLLLLTQLFILRGTYGEGDTTVRRTELKSPRSSRKAGGRPEVSCLSPAVAHLLCMARLFLRHVAL
jgi:hypothetical protein